MNTFNDIKELVTTLKREEKLISEMFSKRKSIDYKYSDAIELVDYNEERIDSLIQKSVIRENGGFLELDDQFLEFFEQVLDVNEEVNLSYIDENIKKIRENMDYFLNETNENKKYSYLRFIKKTFRKIGIITLRSVVDLRRNIENTFKNETNYKNKQLKLENLDVKRAVVENLINQTLILINEEELTFFNRALDEELRKIIIDLKYQLGECSHNLIEIEKQIIDYLNQIKHQGKFSEKLRKLKYLKDLHLKREQKIISEIDYLKKELAKASEKLSEYNSQNIGDLIVKVSKKSTLVNEQKTLGDEKNILKSAFGAISQKYEALISQVQNQKQEYANTQNSEINKIKGIFGDNRFSLFDTYQKLIAQIKEDHKEEKEKAVNELENIKELENKIKRKKAELKYRTFFAAEIEQRKEERKALDSIVSNAKGIVHNSKNKKNTIRKEWELEVTEVERISESKIEKEKEKQEKFASKIESIENKIKQSKSSLYGWLNETVPNWENTIGKVVDEENVLFNTELNPKIIDGNSNTIFGVELNLNSLNNRIKTVKEYNQEIEQLRNSILDVQKSISIINENKEEGLRKLNTKFKKKLNELKEVIAQNEYSITQSEEKLKKNKVELNEWIEKSKSEKETIAQNLENELGEIASKKLKSEELLENVKKGINRKITLKEKERDTEIANLQKAKDENIQEINNSISKNKIEAENRIKELIQEQTVVLDEKGADTKRLKHIDNRLAEIEKALEFIANNERTVFEYEKDKRELFDKVPELKTAKSSLEKKQDSIVEEHRIEIHKLDLKYRSQKETVEAIKSKIDEFEEDEKKIEEFKKSETYFSVQSYFSNTVQEIQETKAAVLIISEIVDKHYKGIETFKELQQATNAFNGNFSERNVFKFKVNLNSDNDFLDFASGLKEFIEEDKMNEFETRVNRRFAHIIQLIGRETTELNSKKGDIEKIIKKINDDFVNKNFVEAIKEMEMRTQESSNPVVKLLIKIQEFNDENSLLLGESSLFTSPDSNSKNQKAVELLKELVKAIEKYKHSSLTLSESFDLQFRIVENDNDSGWVEKLSNVGSEGTDVLVKAMINILLLNVFKDSASRKFKDFKLHCMMDEIGRLHPNNVKGILRFANERNILLINGSPTSQNATDYKYTYKLAKEQSKTDSKRYITKINRLVKINTNTRVLN